MERNKIDQCMTNECPETTPAQLLGEKPTPDDCRAVERAMGRFNSTTGFLNALAQVLLDLEAGPEAELVTQLLPTMAHVEAGAMNGQPTEVRIENTVSETERILRVLHN
jgi:hypothetical protein